jgi:hypothetical protein
MALQGKSVLGAIAAAVAAALAAGCQVSAPPEVWVVGQMSRLTDQSTRAFDPIVYDGQTLTVKLQAAGNETVSFQVVIDAGPQAVAGLAISWTDLAAGGARIKRQEIRAFRCLPVGITALPAWYAVLVSDNKPAVIYDAMLPLEADHPLNLAAGERLVVWFDVSVPADAQAGGYSGDLTVASVSHGPWAARLRLEVLDFALPDARPAMAIGGFDHQELSAAMVSREGKPFRPARLDQRQPEVRQVLAAMRQMSRLARRHGLDLFEMQLRPLLKRDRTGAVRLDWTDYDATVTPYLDGSAFEDGRPVAAWAMPFSDLCPVPQHYGDRSSTEYIRTLAGVQAACRDHFAKLGSAGGAIFAWPQRVVEAQSRGELLVSVRRARQGNRALPVLSQLPPMPIEAVADVSDLSDMVAIPAEWFDPNASVKMSGSHPLAGVWLMPGEGLNAPSLGLVDLPGDACALAWIAARYRCRGLFLPRVMQWAGNPFNAPAGPQTQLFYPGNPVGSSEVLASARLKWLRRGLQDAACLELARQYCPQVAESLVQAMIGRVGAEGAPERLGQWEQDATAWEMARRLMGREIEAALKPAKKDNSLLKEHRQAWRRYYEQIHSPGVERADCSLAPEIKEGKVRMEVSLTLRDPLPQPVSVAAAWKELPEGWQGNPSPKPLTLPAGGRQVVALTAEGSLAPQGAEGKAALQINLTIDGQETRSVPISAPLLLVGAASRAPVIDGALDDWPMLEGNAAGDFRCIVRRGEQTPRPAKRKTHAFVLCDRSSLYIAIRCAEPNLPGVTASASNLVRYEHSLACGEDLVEIVLDPGATAESAEELYHVVVKPNGAMLAERGVCADPGMAKAEAWASGATVAVGRRQDAWVVEMALPLSSFGPAGRARQWRVNFARFAAQANEASSWVAVDRHFYEIDRLGMMVLPSPVQTIGGAAASQP